MTAKTNAVRVLERAGIPFELREYVYDEATFSAEDAAQQVGMPADAVFKTLVLNDERNGHLFALIPASTELDLRTLAQAAGRKRVQMAPQREVQTLTGYLRGAVTVLAAKHAFPVFIDETVELWSQVGISGGAHGLEIVLDPADLLRVTGAQMADIARAPD